MSESLSHWLLKVHSKDAEVKSCKTLQSCWITSLLSAGHQKERGKEAAKTHLSHKHSHIHSMKSLHTFLVFYSAFLIRFCFSVLLRVQYKRGWVITLCFYPKITQLAQLQAGPHYTALQNRVRNTKPLKTEKMEISRRAAFQRQVFI